LAGISIFGLVGLLTFGFETEPPPRSPAVVSAKAAIDPAAPILPAEVVAAMQEGRYEEGRRALIALGEKSKDADDRAYFAFLQAVAERLSGHRDAAPETLRTAIPAAAATRWAAKVRFELAGIELASGNLAAAEELARTEAARLLAGDRKDRLAEVYHAFPAACWNPMTRS